VATVTFPSGCDKQEIFRFCTEVDEHAGVDELLIDFSSMGRIEPFSMAYVAKHIRDFNRKNKGTTVRCHGHQNKAYAANMAFFRAFGLKHGREPNCKEGNESFVPFAILRIQTIVDEASKEWKEAQDIIERRSEHLAKILSREKDGNLVDALTFSIREIMRNVLEHSQSRSIEYCAQFWPTYDKVEIAIVDNGIGLRQSLSANPFIQVQSDSDAIQQALMPAISSKNFKGVRIDRNNPWHNSGFGLYMISRICRLGGSFLICSGDHGIALDEHGKQHIDLGHKINGTAVRMVLNTRKLTDLSQMLAKFKADGYEIAKEIKGVGMYTASAASQMLSRDFKKQA
jgi:anti-sigma regulatory factor (Ser/Thr protein kinase)